MSGPLWGVGLVSAENLMKLDVVEVLQNLVRIPSVNPMGGSIGDVNGRPGSEIYYEGRLTNHLEALFIEIGLVTSRQTVEVLPDGTRRENVLARLDGTRSPDEGGEVMLWEVHQDTVPVTGMTVDPFAAEVRDGKLFGRGACDVKGAMAAMIVALARLAEQRRRGELADVEVPTIVLACTINEEHGFAGARELVRRWQEDQVDEGALLPRRPDVCVVAEPTDLDVVIAHKGVVRWNCVAPGRAAHSSQPELGENAIYRMAKILDALETYSRDVVPGLADHPLCGRPSLSVGTITGGVSVNTVPESCTIAIDRRLTPGELSHEAYQHVVDYLREQLLREPWGQLDFEPQHEMPSIESPGLTDGENTDLAARLSQAARTCGASGLPVGVPYGTDGAIIAETGVPTVVLGPGSIAQAHTADEWIDIEELQKASDIYYRLAVGEGS